MKTNDKNEIYLSVIIPAYNEEERIADTIYDIKEYLSTQDYSSEIIVVDDGSGDLTIEIVKLINIYGKEIKKQKKSKIIENVKNVGKGFSVARGMLKAEGKYILFSDADQSTPIKEVEKLLPYVEDGYDIAIGSRAMKESEVEKKSIFRKMMSISFKIIVNIFAVRGIKDTQCGFKIYKNEIAKQLSKMQKLYQFSFDVEQLFLARKKGYTIKEVAVKWVHMDGSKVSPIKDSIKMFIDVIKIRILHLGD